jgi:chemotaxis response regulator CheB
MKNDPLKKERGKGDARPGRQSKARQTKRWGTGRKPSPTHATSGSPAGVAPFPIVGIGASAGGLEVFTELLKHLPLDTGMGFVIVQHLAPERVRSLAEILSRATTMPVCEVRDEPEVEARSHPGITFGYRSKTIGRRNAAPCTPGACAPRISK